MGERRGPSKSALPVEIDWYDGDRAAIRYLFELAEDSVVQLNSYFDKGRVLLARRGDEPVGHLQLAPTDVAGDVELKSLAVVADERGTGIGRMLIERAVREAAGGDGHTRMLVSTGGADTGNLRFYQRCGFRLLSIDRDAFTPATGYAEPIFIDGVELRDRVWLDQSL
jgi:GNAT superfamily N-acetyltransferase